MRRRSGPQRTWALLPAVLVVAIGAPGLVACTGSDAASTRSVDADSGGSAPPTPAPVLSPLWSRPTNVWGPGETSGRWWTVSTDRAAGPSGSSPPVAVGLQTGDALTGSMTWTADLAR